MFISSGFFLFSFYLSLTILVTAPEVAENACFSAASAASIILSAIFFARTEEILILQCKNHGKEKKEKKKR